MGNECRRPALGYYKKSRVTTRVTSRVTSHEMNRVDYQIYSLYPPKLIAALIELGVTDFQIRP